MARTHDSLRTEDLTVRDSDTIDDAFAPAATWLWVTAAAVFSATVLLLASLWHLHQSNPPESATVRALRSEDAAFRRSLEAMRGVLADDGRINLAGKSAAAPLIERARDYAKLLKDNAEVVAVPVQAEVLTRYLKDIETPLLATAAPALAMRDGEASVRELYTACRRNASRAPSWAERTAAREALAALGEPVTPFAVGEDVSWSDIKVELERWRGIRERLSPIAARAGMSATFCVSPSLLARLQSALESGSALLEVRRVAAQRLATAPAMPTPVGPDLRTRLSVRGAFPLGFAFAAAILSIAALAVLVLILRGVALRSQVDRDRDNARASVQSIGRYTEESLTELRDRLTEATAGVEALREKIKAYGLVSWDLSAAGALQRTQGPLAREAVGLREMALRVREDFHGGEDNERVGYRIAEMISASDTLLESVRTFEKSLAMFREASISGESAQRAEIDRWRSELEHLLVALRGDLKALGERLQSLSVRRG